MQLLRTDPALRLTFGAAGDAHHAGERGQQVGVPHQVRQRGLERWPQPRFRLVRRYPYPAGHQLPVQAVRVGRRVRGAAALQPEGQPAASGADPGDEALAALLDQAGLAEPGFRGQQDDRTMAADRGAQCAVQDPHFRVPVDQRGPAAEPWPPFGDPGPRRVQVAGDQRPGMAAEGDLFCRAPAEQVAGDGPGRRADQHGARPRRRLQRGRHADRVAERAVLHLGAAADRPHHRGAGLHADPQRRLAVGGGRRRRGRRRRGRRRQGAERGTEGSFRVILVRLRRAEHRLKPAAGHRDHRPAQRLHLRDHRRQRAADDLAQRFEAERARARARARQADRGGYLGEQHGHRPAFLARELLRVRLGEWPGFAR